MKESGNASLRIGSLSLAVNAESESRTGQHLRQNPKNAESEQHKCFSMHLRNRKVISERRRE